jgi:predicted nucleotidyltransferase
MKLKRNPAPEISTAAVSEICSRYHIRQLALFGSVARGEAREESDVDVYVEFEAGFHPGLGWFDLEEELERLLGRRVDLSRKSLLKPRVRREALRDAVVLYES